MRTHYDIEEVQDYCNRAFSQQEIVSLYHRFCQLDRNGGGFVSAAEFMPVLGFAVNPLSLGYPDELLNCGFIPRREKEPRLQVLTPMQERMAEPLEFSHRSIFSSLVSILRQTTILNYLQNLLTPVENLEAETTFSCIAINCVDIKFVLLVPDKRICYSLTEENISDEGIILAIIQLSFLRRIINIEYPPGPTTKMAENDTIQLHKAIFAQYIMMKKLFMELEEEREASATAASAALSLIRKLQKEKDIERMEAWQYKRIAEEKMNHTDRALEILKEVMDHKELEISCLKNQVQAYKYKLLDVGINDCDIADDTIVTNIPLSESKSVENPCRNIKRNFSLPTLKLNKLFADTSLNKIDGAVQSARSRLDGYTYNVSDKEWEQIPRDDKALGPMKSLSTDINCEEKNREELNPPSSGTLQHNQPLNESSCCSSSVVSYQTDICNGRILLATKDVMDTLHSDQLKDFCLGSELDGTAVHPTSDVSALQNPERSKTEIGPSCIESDIVTEESESSITVAPKEQGSHTLSRFAATRKIGSMNNVDRHVHLSTGSYTPRAGVQRTKSRLKRVQSAKMVELKESRTSKEQIIMLKEVYQQLDMIESHMRPSGSQESPRNDASLNSVMEAALSFSI